MTRERLTAAIRTGLKRAGLPAIAEVAEKITDCVELAFEMEQGQDEDAPAPAPIQMAPPAKAAPVKLPNSPSIMAAEDTVAILEKARTEGGGARPITVSTLKRGGGSPVASDGEGGGGAVRTIPELISILEAGTSPTIFIEVEVNDEMKKVKLTRNIIAMHAGSPEMGAVKISYASPGIMPSHSTPGGSVNIGLEATAIFYCTEPDVDIETAMISIYTQAKTLYRQRPRELPNSTPKRTGDFSPSLSMGVNGGDSDKL